MVAKWQHDRIVYSEEVARRLGPNAALLTMTPASSASDAEPNQLQFPCHPVGAKRKDSGQRLCRLASHRVEGDGGWRLSSLVLFHGALGILWRPGFSERAGFGARHHHLSRRVIRALALACGVGADGQPGTVLLDLPMWPHAQGSGVDPISPAHSYFSSSAAHLTGL